MSPLHVLRRSVVPALSLLAAAPLSHAGDWSNNGGNPQRNGLSSEVGPLAADPLWNTGRSSIIAWEPMIVGRRVFSVRQTGFPPGGEPNGSPVVCQDLDTGAELWFRHVPYVAGDWTTWILGASGGRVYASRSGNGSSVHQIIYALDETNGNTLWTSTDLIDAGPYDGVVFAPNGDLVVGNQLSVLRISAADGTNVWSAPRLCNVTSSCGVAAFGDGVYMAEPVVGGNGIRKLDLATGQSLYQSPVMIGFTLQNTPCVGPDGTIYLARTQNNPVTDFFYAFEDTGSALTEKWHVDAGWSTTSEFGCGPDGTVYMLDRDFKVRRLDPDTGATLNVSAGTIANSSGSAPHFAIDRSGKVFVSNGGFSNGRLYSFNVDLSLRWSLAVPNVNQGGPALGADGTLVSAGIGTNVRALRSSCNTGAAAVARNAGANPASYAAELPVLGSTWSASVDLTTTGHNLAVLLAYDSPTDQTLPGGQHVLCANGGSGQLLHLVAAGPLATFSAAVPNDAALCGVTLCSQAVHFGGVQPFALSNAIDLTVGG